MTIHLENRTINCSQPFLSRISHKAHARHVSSRRKTLSRWN